MVKAEVMPPSSGMAAPVAKPCVLAGEVGDHAGEFLRCTEATHGVVDKALRLLVLADLFEERAWLGCFDWA
jgi:hypothetical protein